MKFFKQLLLISIFLCIPALSVSSHPVVEKVDTSEYPKIKISIREEVGKPLQNEKIRLYESIQGKDDEILVMDLLKKNEIRKVRLLLSIQASDEENNKKTRELAEAVLRSLNLDDQIILHIYGEDTIFFDDKLDKHTALTKINNLPNASKNSLYSGIQYLYSNVPLTSIPSFYILISPNSPTEVFDTNSPIIELSERKHLPIHILSSDEPIGNFLAQKTSGSFFAYNKKDSITKLQSEFGNIRNEPGILEYYTIEQPLLSLISPTEVLIDLKIGNWDFDLKYNLSIWTIFYARLMDIEFFYTLGFFLILLSFLIYYSFRRSREVREAEKKRKIIDEKYKADLYYHENNSYDTGNKVAVLTTKSVEEYGDDFIPEEDDYDPYSIYTEESDTYEEPLPPMTDLPEGEAYEKAFFIQKEGPNPGRQYNITLEEVYIGKATDNDLILIDNTVSDKHAKIKIIRGVHYLYDLVSNRGTYVNGKKLLRPKALSDFDEIRLGKTLLLFRGNK
ncbi:MAG: FHA domain-containing protein [Leptospiraceae bacterium]|nr:FHA domain-containing protein [Leptospiraceae bacterium]MCP5511368.1 FHA domain-containing protein [Leptospiraceae bacterium]